MAAMTLNRGIIRAIFVCCLCAGSTFTATDINVAFFAPRSSVFGLNVSSSVLAVINAVEDIEQQNLLPGYTLNVTWYDSACSGKQAAGKAAEAIMRNQVDVLIGPPCSEASEAVGQLASYFNLPMFTWYSPDLQDRTTLSTLVRTFAPARELGSQLVEGLQYFNWHRCGFVYSAAQADLAMTLYSQLRQGRIKVVTSNQVKVGQTPARISRLFENVKREARIVVLILPRDELRKYMLVAHDLRMSDGDYCFLSVEYDVTQGSLSTHNFWRGTDGRDGDARKAFRSLIYLSAVDFSSPLYDGGVFLSRFVSRGLARAAKRPWNETLPEPTPTTDLHVPYLYDAVYLYALVAKATLQDGGDIRNGSLLADKTKLMTFNGSSGSVVMGAQADRLSQMWYLGMDERNNVQPVGYINPRVVNGSIVSEVQIVGAFSWLLGAPPRDTPICGFHGSKCDVLSQELVAAVVVSCCVVTSLASLAVAILIYRKKKMEEMLGGATWDARYDEIDFNFRQKECRPQSIVSLAMTPFPLADPARNTHVLLALYRGSVVEVYHHGSKHVTPSDTLRIELSQLRSLSHPNLNVFLGVCLSGPVCILWQHCAKGSLKAVLEKSTVKLDMQFKMSIIRDIIRGMEYLHDSPIGSHGNLTSSNVVVDPRWCAKVTGYGLGNLNAVLRKQGLDPEGHSACEDLFWTAPELLREGRPTLCGTKTGDVYSFGVIAKEVLTRTAAYAELEGLSGEEILNRIRTPKDGQILRPQLPSPDRKSGDKEADEMYLYMEVIQTCWSEDVNRRPTFKCLLRKILHTRKGSPTSLMDNMLQMLEKYADHLEEIVAERTGQLEEEKRRTDLLLYRMLPQSVAESLKQGRQVTAESFEAVTIYFSDIVGFTNIAAASTPLQIVALLNALYILFDDTITKHDVYKVETIGDAYMIVSGLPTRNDDRHVIEVANCALDLRTAVAELFTIPHKPDTRLAIRIGLHTGPCVAGVVGLAMPRYCLFGDTVNTASRMESNGEAMKIHLSTATYNALARLGGHQMALRGNLAIKGKGNMETYWLLGKMAEDGIESEVEARSQLRELDCDMNETLSS